MALGSDRCPHWRLQSSDGGLASSVSLLSAREARLSRAGMYPRSRLVVTRAGGLSLVTKPWYPASLSWVATRARRTAQRQYMHRSVVAQNGTLCSASPDGQSVCASTPQTFLLQSIRLGATPEMARFTVNAAVPRHRNNVLLSI